MPVNRQLLTASNVDESLLLAIADAHRSLSTEYLTLPKWQQSWLPMSHLREAHEQGWVAYRPAEWIPGTSRHGSNLLSEALHRLEATQLVECDRTGRRARRVRLTVEGRSVAGAIAAENASVDEMAVS